MSSKQGQWDSWESRKMDSKVAGRYEAATAVKFTQIGLDRG